MVRVYFVRIVTPQSPLRSLFRLVFLLWAGRFVVETEHNKSSSFDNVIMCCRCYAYLIGLFSAPEKKQKNKIMSN